MKTLLTFLRRFLGAVIFLACGLVAITLAIGGFYPVAALFGLMALFGLYLMRRRSAPSTDSKSTSRKSQAPASAAVWKAPSTGKRGSGGKYGDYRWGTPAPSARQFGYGSTLGVSFGDGMTRKQVSYLISQAERGRDETLPPTDEQLEEAKKLGLKVPRGISKAALDELLAETEENQEPATDEQLAEIEENHGVLPRDITYGEAEEVIKFLFDHTLPCPFCGSKIHAIDTSCLDCGKSLKKLRIPIKLK